MNEDGLIERITPVFDTPDVDKIKEVSALYTKNIVHVVARDTTKSLISFNEILTDFYNIIEKEWECRPQAFRSIDSANGYLMHVENSLVAGREFIESLSKKYSELQKNEIVDHKINGIQCIILLILSFGAAAETFDKTHGLGDWRILLAIVAFFGAFWGLIIVATILDYPFKLLRRRKFNRNPPPLPEWIISASNNLSTLTRRIADAKNEIYEDVGHTKKLMKQINENMVDDHFAERRDKRAMGARLEMIKAESEYAKATAQTLEEQHRLTEAVRVKYAEELINLERQVRAENNQDLTDKLAMVQELLGGEE